MNKISIKTIKKIQKRIPTHERMKSIIEKKMEELQTDIKDELSNIMDCTFKHSVDDNIYVLEKDIKKLIKRKGMEETVCEKTVDDAITNIVNEVVLDIKRRVKKVENDIKRKYVSQIYKDLLHSFCFDFHSVCVDSLSDSDSDLDD